MIQEAQPSAQEVQEPEIEQQVVKKSRAKIIRLRPEDLTNPDQGLLRLYKLTNNIDKSGDPAKFMGRVMSSVRLWANETMPRYDFDYFCERVQKMGGKPEITKHLSEIRALHLGEITEEELRELHKLEVDQMKLAAFDQGALIEETKAKKQRPDFVFRSNKQARQPSL